MAARTLAGGPTERAVHHVLSLVRGARALVATVEPLGPAQPPVHCLERDGYHAENEPEHRRASFWQVSVAKVLGPQGRVHPKRFEPVLAGCIPGANIRLGRVRDGEGQQLSGLDISSRPRSPSQLSRSSSAMSGSSRRTTRRTAKRPTGWSASTSSRAATAARAGLRHARRGNPALDEPWPGPAGACGQSAHARDEERPWRGAEP